MMPMLGTAAVFGLLGSLHCTFMCGPLALAGCTEKGKLCRRGVAAYVLGRLVAYMFVGALFGALGQHLQHHPWTRLVQRALLVAVAAMAFAKGVRLLFGRERSTEGRLVKLRPRRRAIWDHVAAWLPRRGMALGLVTGGLPCGLLVGAWMLAASSGHPLTGSLMMAAFSLATLPALFIGLVAHRIRLSPAWSGLLWCALAVWIGLRPLFAMHGAGAH